MMASDRGLAHASRIGPFSKVFGRWDAPVVGGTEAAALLYIAFPSVIFVAGWIVAPWGPLAAVAMALALASLTDPFGRGPRFGVGSPWRALAIIVVASAWCLLGGIDHLFYANRDWVVRDAVLVDLVRKAWPVRYHLFDVDVDVLLRAPIAYFLPAALVGKIGGVALAGHALLLWTIAGVALTFALMLRDRPSSKAATIRVVVFVAFSGLDIVGTFARYNPHGLGDHLEWWAYFIQYSSQTTQLFWVPNHALPGWIAIAWLLGQEPVRLPTTPAILFTVFAPLWSPLTALGIAPLVGVALFRQATADGAGALRPLLDWRMVVCAVGCLTLVYPYLVAGSETVASGSSADLRWVGEDIVPRTIEFLILEVAGFAVVLLTWRPRDPLLWTALIILAALPWHRFGPYNDLAMRASIPGLTLLAITLGRVLSEPRAFVRHRRKAIIATVLLCVGAATPTMELARPWIEPAWPVDAAASLPDVTRGTHYLASPDQPWLRRFLKDGGTAEVAARRRLPTPPTSPPASPAAAHP